MFKSTNMPLASLDVELLTDRRQIVASSNHRFPLIRREEVGQKLNPMSSQADNLQKYVPFFLLKVKSF
jgi:hypothetical protein